jgi:adenylyltransferase/sulfurtransferase
VRLVDDDLVERSNLPRQVLHREADIGRPKVDSAMDGLRRWLRILPGAALDIEARRERFDVGSASRLLDGMDLVIDASDNFPTKYRVNASARAAGIPAVIGGALRMDGQVFGVSTDGPCYRCVFAHSPEPGATPTCSSVGILGPVVGLVGLRQVAVGAALLAGAGRVELLNFDGRGGRWTGFGVGRRPDCLGCGPHADEPWMR